jgi:hypothetical protein
MYSSQFLPCFAGLMLLVVSAPHATIAAGASIGVAEPGARQPSVDEVLARAARYVADFTTEFANVVSEERYVQDVRGRPGTSSPTNLGVMHRELRSDLLLVRPVLDDRWIQFRDVFEVDRRPVRDRDERLVRLFLEPSAANAAQAETIANESARYNIGNIQRNINVPVLALVFLEVRHQPRFVFRRGGGGNLRALAGLAATPEDIWDIEYREVQRPTLIHTESNRDLPTHGRFWIDVPTGRVLRTRLVAEDAIVRGQIDVTYRFEPGVGLLVPAEMHEEYFSRAKTVRVLGHATYGRFRQFSVKVDTDIPIRKPPPGETPR